MGTNFYFFRRLTAEEERAVVVVAAMHAVPETWSQPVPFAVPQEVRQGTELNKLFVANRKKRYDELRAPKHLGPWDDGKSQYTYWLSSEKYSNHIGKRSAAGLWCWDCSLTLCKGGESGIHTSKNSEWFSCCPRCQKKPTEKDHAMKVELGQASPRQELPKGVSSCSSFSWALDKTAFHKWAEENPEVVNIHDEYGREYSAAQFVEMLRLSCPVQKHDSIGVEFS